ncbi:MAG: hypothetical protein KDE68_05660 [Rhodocyclaceae bacterium]|nr:hypothetical protein [Rhodocyclaceae bacterium]
MTRPLIALLCLISLAGCTARGGYEALRSAEHQRQAQQPGEPARSHPDVSYDRYQAERQAGARP